jgi:hypothetical protein
MLHNCGVQVTNYLTLSEFYFLLNKFGHDHLIQDDFFISRRAAYHFFLNVCVRVFACMHHGAIASVAMGEEALLLRQHEHKICGGAHLGSAFVSVRPHDELAMQARAHRGRFFVLKRLCARLIYNLLRTIFSSSQTHTTQSLHICVRGAQHYMLLKPLWGS